ncbi:PRR36 protein, partial [Polyodon spathula]|nr:PRR36 protein [Polyodon spathula]
METTEDEEEELDEDVFEKELGDLGGGCESERGGDQHERPLQTRKRLLLLGCGKADMVEQLINQTLLISGERSQLLPHKGGTISEVEIGQWTQLISPMDDSRASITSVTSYSPEDVTSPQGDWTVVELETHH